MEKSGGSSGAVAAPRTRRSPRSAEPAPAPRPGARARRPRQGGPHAADREGAGTDAAHGDRVTDRSEQAGVGAAFVAHRQRRRQRGHARGPQRRGGGGAPRRARLRASSAAVVPDEPERDRRHRRRGRRSRRPPGRELGRHRRGPARPHAGGGRAPRATTSYPASARPCARPGAQSTPLASISRSFAGRARRDAHRLPAGQPGAAWPTRSMPSPGILGHALEALAGRTAHASGAVRQRRHVRGAPGAWCRLRRDALSELRHAGRPGHRFPRPRRLDDRPPPPRVLRVPHALHDLRARRVAAPGRRQARRRARGVRPRQARRRAGQGAAPAARRRTMPRRRPPTPSRPHFAPRA